MSSRRPHSQLSVYTYQVIPSGVEGSRRVTIKHGFAPPRLNLALPDVSCEINLCLSSENCSPLLGSSSSFLAFCFGLASVRAGWDVCPAIFGSNEETALSISQSLPASSSASS